MLLPETDLAPGQTTPPGWLQAPAPAPTLLPSHTGILPPAGGEGAAQQAVTPKVSSAAEVTFQEAGWQAAPTRPASPLEGTQEKSLRSRLSRRTFLLGGAAGLVLLGGGAAALALTHHSIPTTAAPGTPKQITPTGPTPTATPLSRGTQLYAYTGHANLLPIAWSPDSKRLLAGSYIIPSGSNELGAVQSWGALDGSAPITYVGGLTANVNTVAWSPDGARVAAGTSDGMLYGWDAATGAELQAIKVAPYPLPGNSGAVNTIEMIGWSPNGALLAVGSGYNLLQVRSGTSLQVIQNGFDPTPTGSFALGAEALSWSPDSSQLVAYCGALAKVFIWDIASGQGRFLFTVQLNDLVGLAWSPDGASIASCQALKNISLWDAESLQQRWTTPIGVGFPTIAWSPDSAYLAVVDQTHGYTALLESVTGKVVFTGFPYVEMLAWSPDGTLLAASSASGVLVMKAR